MYKNKVMYDCGWIYAPYPDLFLDRENESLLSNDSNNNDTGETIWDKEDGEEDGGEDK